MRTYFFVVTYSLTKICENIQYLITVNFATAIPLACPLDLKINSAYYIMVYFQGCKGQYRAPKSYWAIQTLSGPMPLNHFLSDGCRSSFKSEGDNDIRIQLGPMKNTTKHKIDSNPATGSGVAL